MQQYSIIPTTMLSKHLKGVIKTSHSLLVTINNRNPIRIIHEGTRHKMSINNNSRDTMFTNYKTIAHIPELSDTKVEHLDDSLQYEQFDDHQVAYESKTLWELSRSAFFYFLFRFPIFTDRSENIMSGMNRVLGRRLSEAILKPLIYAQYVAGETNEEIKQAVERLHSDGIGPLVAVPIEDDIHAVNRSQEDQETVLDQNLETILNCMSLTREIAKKDPMFQLRLTALASPQLMKHLSVVCSTRQPGTAHSSLSEEALQVFIRGLQGKQLNVPKADVWNQVRERKEELERFLARMRVIAQALLESGQLAMVDAEYTYFNPAIRHVTLAMMQHCCVKRPLVFYTYQAYLKGTLEQLRFDMAHAKTNGYCFGVKLVRGAYVLKERSMAKAEGYPDPVHDTFENTSRDYSLCLDDLVGRANENQDRIRFIVASHNEESIRHAFRRMHQMGLPKDSRSVLFGQLYGMADHVSYTLGKRGVNVVKSLPYGTLKDTLPYLARRATENRSIFENVRKEKSLVKKALWQRIRGQ